uniref:Uncharacterized protein n=1 Tax=Molossus molossus TaxID=27622 RepID=A0A7J8E2Z3_MOLMO|nr:hypothetical protein HJG59_008994 [Molossus molossus]
MPGACPMLGQKSPAVNSYRNNEIKEEENGMGVGGRTVFSASASASRDPWPVLQVLGSGGLGPLKGRGSPGVLLPSWGIIHCSQRCCCCLCLRLPRRHRRMREKQKGMGRSSGGESDVAAALRPQLSCPAGVGQGAGPRGGRREPRAARAPGTGVHADQHPADPSGMTDSGADLGPAPTRRVAAQPPPAVTPLSPSMLGVVVPPLLTRIWQVAAAFSSWGGGEGGPSLSGMQPPE